MSCRVQAMPPSVGDLLTVDHSLLSLHSPMLHLSVSEQQLSICFLAVRSRADVDRDLETSVWV